MSSTTGSGKSPSMQHFKPGEIIFSQGDAAEHVFIVSEGEVELLIGDKVIATEQQGGIIGEMALLNESTRSMKGSCRWSRYRLSSHCMSCASWPNVFATPARPIYREVASPGHTLLTAGLSAIS
jgi:hypothetical protein